jgi:hypothetical protein
VTDALPPERVRITDAERGLAEERLRQAHANGSLDLAEFDQRTARLWQEAKTRADLAAITADLPAPVPADSPAPPPAPSGDVHAMRVLTAIWLSASALNLVVWLMVVVSTANTLTGLHPWWVWVLVPPGSVLGVLWAMGIGRRRR